MNALSALPIGEVSRRSGFSTDTLRYYERLGLIPAPARNDAGRRAYDAPSLDRLRFIARAKELGCSLDEIASLLTAWDADCSDVQSGLRSLVDRRIGDAQRRVAELVAFTAQLQEARHVLATSAGTAPDVPCGPDCACLDAGSGPTRIPTIVALATDAPAIACTLDHEDMASRIAEWQGILADVTERSPIDGGIRLTFAPTIELGEVVRLARAEWSCCSFFSFAVTVDGRGAALEVRSPGEAGELVASVFGVA
jgi:MerR family transcriptional regulator, copper efflux regulator